MHVEVASPARAGGAALLRETADLDSRHHAQKVVPVAKEQRGLLDYISAHDGSNGSIVRRKAGSRTRYLYGFFCCAHTQHKVLADFFRRVECHSFTQGSKALSTDGDAIRANRKFLNGVVTGWVSLDDARVASGRTLDRDLHLSDSCVRRVCNQASQARGIDLGKEEIA